LSMITFSTIISVRFSFHDQYKDVDAEKSKH